MTLTSETFMDRENHDLRARLSGFLYGQYQSERASRLSQDIRCSPRTAQNILDSHWPNARCWQAIVQRFGADAVMAVFGPDIDETRARLQAEVRQLEEQLDRKRASLRKAGEPMAGDQGGLASLQDGAAGLARAPEPRSFRR
jgi:hypothetical protein